MSKISDGVGIILRDMYIEAFNTHPELKSSSNDAITKIILTLMNSDINHIEYICHLDLTRYIGQNSHIFNENMEALALSGEAYIPDNFWPEISALSSTEQVQVLEKKSLQMLTLKNILENGGNLPLDRPIITGGRSWFEYYNENVGGQPKVDDMTLITTGTVPYNGRDIPIVKGYVSQKLVTDLCNPSSHLLKSLTSEQLNSLEIKLIKELKMYRYFLKK